MNKKLATILSVATLLVLAGMVLLPQPAFAAESGIVTGLAKSAVNTFLANIGNVFLTFTAMLLTIAGTFLSVSINITTHLKDIYDSIPAIKAVWVTIRNISSIFVIFSLLYFSIGTILGVGSGFNKIVVKVFLAGILINFSLFFFKLAIDASNIISLQFYRAIAPNTEQNWSVGQAFTDGGLSNIFLQSLKIQKIYQNSGVLKAADVSLGIGFATYSGVILMAVAFLSLFAAGIAFTARTALLIFCLAMSPLYFVGMIFPEIKKKVSDRIIGLLYSQCVFMPVYLFLLYVALKIISDPNFNAIFNNGATGATDPGGFGPVWIGTIIQYTIAIFFINLPLVAALDLGAKGMSWAPQAGAIGKWMTGGYGKSIGGAVGRNTLGWAGKKVGEQFDNMASVAQGSRTGRVATSVLRNLGISQAVRGGLTQTEGGRYGGRQSLADVDKENKEREKQVRKVTNIRNLDAAIAANNDAEIKKILSNMSSGEIAALNTKKYLANAAVVPHLSSGVYSSVDKGDKPDADKVKIKEIRFNTLHEAARSGNSAKTRDLMKNMTGEDIQEYIEYCEPKGMPVLDIPFLENLKPNHLKKMEGLKDSIRKSIGTSIRDWNTLSGLGFHASHDYIDKNQKLWT